jgi:hypothetical protein
MKKTILAAAILLAGAAITAMPAQAEFVLNDFTFADLGATGFGNAPRLLTLQNTPNQSGAVVSNGGATGFLSPITIDDANNFAISGTVCTSNGTCSGGGLRTGANESTLVNVTALWTSGAQVGVGLDTNQTGSTGALLFSELVLNIYSSTGALLGTFGGNDPVLISEALLALQQGNGNSVFNLGLTAGEQAEFNTLLAALPPGSSIFAGLAAAFGCTPAPCVGDSNDGADSFLAFAQSAAVPIPGPIAGAGLPGLIAACGGLFGLNWWRRRRQSGNLPA